MGASALDAIRAAESKIGAPYVWGAQGPSSFDCSGLMVWAWNKAGVHLPRTSQAMAKYGTPVKPTKIQPGDLVTSNWGSGPASHVAMYIGAGKVIHAPRPGRSVTVASLDKNYLSHVDSIRRIPGVSIKGITQADLHIPSPGELFDLEKKGFKDLFGVNPDDALGGILNGLGDSITAPFNVFAAALTEMAKGMLSIGQFAEFLLKLMLPSTWVRIGCGVLGTLVLVLGVAFLVREARGA